MATWRGGQEVGEGYWGEENPSNTGSDSSSLLKSNSSIFTHSSSLFFLSLTGTPEAPGMTAGGVHVGVDGVDGVAGVVGLKTDARSGVAGLERGRFATALLLPFSPFFSFTGTPEAPAIAAGGVGGVAGAPGDAVVGVEPDKSIRLGHCTRVTRKKYGGAS